MYLYNKWCVFILFVKEVLLVIMRTFYPAPLYLILIYCEPYRYLIVCFAVIRCFRFRLIRNYKSIKVKKITFN